MFFKLYSQMGLSYPPVFADALVAQGAALAAVQMTPIGATAAPAPSTAIVAASAPVPVPAKGDKQLKSIKSAVAKIASQASAVAEDSDSDSGSDSGGDGDAEGLTGDGPEAVAKSKQRRVQQRLFKGLTFFLSREVRTSSGCVCVGR